jgi:hypothetical protein
MVQSVHLLVCSSLILPRLRGSEPIPFSVRSVALQFWTSPLLVLLFWCFRTI